MLTSALAVAMTTQALNGELSVPEHGFVTVPLSRLSWQGAEGGPRTAQIRLAAATPVTEAIASWTARAPRGGQIEIRAGRPGGRAYSFGRWSESAGRTSVKGQKDAEGDMQTDTLVLAEPTRELDVTITLTGPVQLRDLHVVLNGALTPDTLPANKAAWGLTLEPPRRAQMSYPNGGVLCSPTSISMVLGYWAQVLGRPELDADVPEVQQAVFDPGWGGTGNWPFNVAFGGSRSGLTGAVTRLRGIADAERFLLRGIPVVCSVRYALLKGQPKAERGDGHLVVLVGFTPEGDPIFNDPGRNVVRLTYKRDDFRRAWEGSGRTVYLVYPRYWATPAENGPWPRRRSEQILP